MINAGPDAHVILVHLGSDWVEYVDDCIVQVKLFNPNIPLWVCASKQHRTKTRNDFLNGSFVHWVDCEELEPTSYHRRFIKRSKLDGKWRGGFWRLASERFFIIDELMKLHGLTDCVHIENDNLLFADLSELMPVFRAQPAGILAPFDNDDRCVPSFIYVRNQVASGQLCEFLAEASRKTVVNDMEALAMYRRVNPGTSVGSLPILPAGYQCSWTTPSGKKSTDPAIFTHLAAEFGSIFDAAAIGQFLTGVLSEPSLRGFVNESCVFDPSTLEIEWREDHLGRRSPYVRWKDKLVRINNLHIHSKQLRLYSSTSNARE
jgi:hypothetical protein